MQIIILDILKGLEEASAKLNEIIKIIERRQNKRPIKGKEIVKRIKNKIQ